MSLCLATVIVPTFNGEKRVAGVLQSLEAQSFKDFEVIVVIDGGWDDTERVVRSYVERLEKLKILTQKNKGRAGARNSGAKESESNILVFIDDDMRLEPDVIHRHILHHTNAGRSILVGNQKEDALSSKTDVQRYKSELSEKWMKKFPKDKYRMDEPFVTAANFSVPRDLFFEMGAFDETLTDCEDYDFALNANASGVPLYIETGIVGWHHNDITAESYSRRLKEYNKAREIVHKKHAITMKVHRRKLPTALYWFFGRQYWIMLIDNNALIWLPKKLRYRFFDLILYSNSIKDIG